MPRLSATPSAATLDGKLISVSSSRLAPFGSGSSQGNVVTFDGLRAQLSDGTPVTASLGQREVRLTHELSERQAAMVLAGGRIPLSASPDS